MNPKIQLYCPDANSTFCHRVLGIDASLTSTGLVVIGGGEILYHKAVQSKKTGVPRLLEIEAEVERVIKTYDIDLVTIEDYAYAKNNQAHQIGELGGVIRRRLYLMKIPFKVISPSQIKQFATSKGNTKKEDMKLAVFKRWGVEFPTNDEVDAFIAAVIGQALTKAQQVPEFLSQLPQHQILVLQKLLGGKKK